MAEEPDPTDRRGLPPVLTRAGRARHAAGQGPPLEVDPAAGTGPPVDAGGRLTRLGPVSPYRARRRHRFRRKVRLLITLGAVLVLIVIGGVVWYETTANPSGGAGQRVVLQVHRGEAMNAIVADLAKEQVIGSSLAFQLSLVLHGTPAVRPGGYVLRRNQSFATVRSKLAAGPNVYLVDVPPGFTLAEVAHVLSTDPGNLAVSFLRQAKAGAVVSPFQSAPSTSLEGLLGAGTYQVFPGETAHRLLTQMVQRFDQAAAAAGVTPAAAAAVGLTPYQLVTVASIVQKEGYYDRYMGQVARVIYNRLADGMTLGMTSTVLYALGQDGGAVTPADRHLASPYNTYLNRGLTPTPICFPSATALRAAAAPPAGTWLYFDLVTVKKGLMVFSTTYAQQLVAEKQAQANAASGGG